MFPLNSGVIFSFNPQAHLVARFAFTIAGSYLKAKQPVCGGI
jgi:hypothetical protein